ncbi:lysine N(6)-hydroxylase/L-ornithine N(5)-oxygenase family protein [Streptomyces tanashiensis]
MTAMNETTPVYDVVGVGFGPANLALAIAVEEYNEQAAPGEELTAVFLEKQPNFGWHRGMLLPDATMQVSFLKDLATMRNPLSRFGFVPYLHDRGRLVDFINHKMLFPTREEFHDYLQWAANGVDHMVRGRA